MIPHESEVGMISTKTEQKTYILAHDEYMGQGPGMSEFRGSFRQLLYHLLDVGEGNTWGEDIVVPFTNVPEGVEEGDPRYYKPYKEWSNEELEKLFTSGNGDGQVYYMAWCVEDGKQVLG